MEKIIAAAIFSAMTLVAVPAFAMDGTVHGFDADALQVTLNDMGTNVSDLEEWGGYIRGWTSDASGKYAMILIDADTLQVIR